jgi:hypothetical protein
MLASEIKIRVGGVVQGPDSARVVKLDGDGQAAVKLIRSRSGLSRGGVSGLCLGLALSLAPPLPPQLFRFGSLLAHPLALN